MTLATETMATQQAQRPSTTTRHPPIPSAPPRAASGVREVSTEDLIATRLALGQSYFDKAKQ